ncbi:MAG: hypothetical protein RBR15_09315 [Sphaerochaeta sp.]|nr:hypothetical protein [Sphaerochaeta sp.]
MRLATMVRTLLSHQPDYLVSVGGDGLASYIASTVVAMGSKVTLLGIAAGTANVGPIVSFPFEQISRLQLSDLEAVPIDGISVSDESGYLGIGFNDVILGNSFLGTESGVCCNLSVEELLVHQKRVPIEVGRRIVTEEFSVALDGQGQTFFTAVPIEQIVISPLQFDRLYGRAVLGGLCLGRDAQHLAAIGIASRNVVDANPMAWGFSGFTAIQHLVFSKDREVVLSSLGPDAHIIIDGNPFLRKGAVRVALVPGAIKAMKLKGVLI